MRTANASDSPRQGAWRWPKELNLKEKSRTHKCRLVGPCNVFKPDTLNELPAVTHHTISEESSIFTTLVGNLLSDRLLSKLKSKVFALLHMGNMFYLAVHGGPTTCSLATNTPPSLLGVCSNLAGTWPPESLSRVSVSASFCTPLPPWPWLSWGKITSLSSLLESVGTNSLLALPLSPSLLRSPCHQCW